MKRNRLVWVATVVVVALAAIATQHEAEVLADHADGNMPAWPNQWDISDQLRICNGSTNVSTTQLNGAISIWNTGVSATILVNSCTNSGVAIDTVPDGYCGTPPPGLNIIACTNLPSSDSTQLIYLHVESDAPTDDNSKKSLVAHELGHDLGFDHTPVGGTTCNPNSIMSPVLCSPPVMALQSIDKTNYYNGYHIDAVTGFSASSPSAGTVNFTWNQSNIHNEKGFLINWLNDCTGQWQIAAAPAQNASTFTLTGQQGGVQQYQILGLTNADPVHGPGGEVVSTTVTVSASLPPPGSMTSSFPSTTVTRFTWPAVSGAHHYKVKFDVVPSGMYVPSCVDNITPTQYDWAVPTQHQVPWYTKVTACTSAGVCSAPTTTRVLTERFNSGAWNYVFTTYRSGTDNIFLNFINFNPNLMALKLHIRNGDSATSPLVTSSSCIPYGTIGSVGPMSAFYSFTSGKLATQGHGIYSADTCASTDANDSTSVAWGYIPPQ